MPILTNRPNSGFHENSKWPPKWPPKDSDGQYLCWQEYMLSPKTTFELYFNDKSVNNYVSYGFLPKSKMAAKMAPK